MSYGLFAVCWQEFVVSPRIPLQMEQSEGLNLHASLHPGDERQSAWRLA